ncbi:MAG: LptF/LptG family permease [Planctomycetota bacterium]
MPWTLYKYILRETGKLLLLTTLVLVVVMSFGAAVQPMSDGKLSPGVLVKFVLFTAPTVLGFALPFAGAFASTLVFIRLANDNEILACSASGISYLRILAPVFALGLVLTGGMLLLANSVVPSFYRLAERTVESDAITLLVTELNKQRFVELKEQDLVIYAETATQFPPQPITGSVMPMTQLIQLEGVAVGEIVTNPPRPKGEKGPAPRPPHIGRDTTAKSATLAVFGDPESDDAWVQLTLDNVVRYDPVTGGLIRVDQLPTRPLPIPSLFSDSPKFLSSSQLKAYEREPERHKDVRDRLRDLASAMATESLRQAFVEVKDHAILHGPLTGDRYVLSAPKIEEDGDLLRLSGDANEPVRVAFYADGRVAGTPARVYEAPTAFVRVRTNALNPEPSIDMELRNVSVVSGGSGTVVGNKLIELRQLSWPKFLPDGLKDRRAADLLDEARRETYSESESVWAMTHSVQQLLATLKGKIVAQRHERAASAVSCALLLLLGAMLSIRFRGQSPLVVYFWSFLLAIVTLIIISSGVNVASGTSASLMMGMTVVWSGNALLLVVLLLTYRRLSRN